MAVKLSSKKARDEYIALLKAPPAVLWRDIDNNRQYWGLVVHRKGLGLYLGKRLYRLRWSL